MESEVKWNGSVKSLTKQASRHAHALALTLAHNLFAKHSAMLIFSFVFSYKNQDECGDSGSSILIISLMLLFEARDRQKFCRRHMLLTLSKLHSISSFLDSFFLLPNTSEIKVAQRNFKMGSSNIKQ
ncbi:unnamed protein product [Brugia pahangi]|uniref:Ovule protein n=1 Tax=Brugia pahangi TaxID=6280 RepID=A0A0N4TC06_BRUPA|nr:unnamed protein product [Brugia pahangi]